MKANQKSKEKRSEIETEFPGYPLYPASEDIYSKGIKEDNIDPENINKLKEPNDKIRNKFYQASNLQQFYRQYYLSFPH